MQSIQENLIRPVITDGNKIWHLGKDEDYAKEDGNF